MLARTLLWATGHVPPQLLRQVSGLRWRMPFLRPVFDRLGDVLRNKDLVIQRGPAAGLRFNSGTSMAGYVVGYMEPHVLELVNSLLAPGDVAYDLGANIGYLSMLMARQVGPTGAVVCFEPTPSNAAQLRHNAALNGFTHVLVREEAVADRDGEAAFVIDTFAAYHRLAEPGRTALDARAVTTVPLRALDGLLGTLPPPSFMKIDIEGAETMALRGAQRMLEIARPTLLIELHGTKDELLPLLEEHAYQVTVVRDEGVSEESAWENWNAHILAVPRATGAS